MISPEQDKLTLMESPEVAGGSAESARRSTRVWLRVLISVAALGWVLQQTEWTPILHAFARVRLEFFFAAVGLYCVCQVLISSYRWQLLARPLGFEERLPRFTALYMVGLFFNLFLPTSIGGDVVRAWYLGGQPGRRWIAALSVFNERLTGLLALLMIACLSAWWSFGTVPTWTAWTVWGLTALAGLGLGLLPFLARWSAKCRSVLHGLSIYGGQQRRWLFALVLSIPVQVLSIGQIWLLGQALGLPVPLLTYAIAVPLISLLTMLPISINGVGIREGLLVLLLAPAGVGSEQALALGLLWFCLLAVSSLFGGAVYLLGGFSRKELNDTYGPVSGHSDQGRTGQSAAAA